jgi:hypothetical protein
MPEILLTVDEAIEVSMVLIEVAEDLEADSEAEEEDLVISDLVEETAEVLVMAPVMEVAQVMAVDPDMEVGIIIRLEVHSPPAQVVLLVRAEQCQSI